MRAVRLIFPMLVSCLLLSSAAYAQGAIAGVVRDASGAVLPGVSMDSHYLQTGPTGSRPARCRLRLRGLRVSSGRS